MLDVRDQAKAAAFVRAHGAIAAGSYRGTALLAYRTGLQLAFVSHYLVLGQDASVRAAIDVAGGRTSSLAASGVYQRAIAAEPPGRVLDAYASLAGVRRLLAPQGGVVGAIGSLLYQPALQGVALSLTPTAQGARMQIHSALDPSLTRLSPPATSVFTPTLESVMPAGAILVFDVAGLDRVAPSVLNAGAAAGVAGGLGPLLSRLGTALTAEGVNVKQLTSIFHPETAAAIVPHAGRPALVLVARTRNAAQTRTELASAEAPLEQLFTPTSSSGPGKVPVFNDRAVDGITAHQLQLANGFELDYAVFRGLVVISTSLDGVAAIADRSHPLASDPGFRFALGAPAQPDHRARLPRRRPPADAGGADRSDQQQDLPAAALRPGQGDGGRPELDPHPVGDRLRAGHPHPLTPGPRIGQTPSGAAGSVPRSSCSARSTVRTISRGLATPRKAKSNWASPAVSKVTEPTRRIRSPSDWVALTFCTRSRRVWCRSRDNRPVSIVSR